MPQCHIYCRVSSTGQEDGYSLDTQEAACRTYAREHDLHVASAIREVWSGGDRHRPQLDVLLDGLTPGDVVLCYALDRLSRSQVDTAILIDRIESAGARLAICTEDYERSATGVFLRNAKSFVAELEREKIAERTQRGRRARVASGKPIVGPRAAYGYTWSADKTRYVLDLETAPVVRMIFDWALDGVTLRGIAARLSERGIPSPTGQGRWSPAVLRHLLLRHVYTGDAMAYARRADRRPGGGYHRRAGTAEELVAVPNVAEPIVTHAEMAAVAARLTTNKAHAARNNRNPEAALLRAGFAVCGHCGWSLAVGNPAGSASVGESARYRCDERARHTHGCPVPSIAAGLVDGPVWSRVSEVLRDPEIIAREVARHRRDGGIDRDLDAIEKQYVSIADKQARTARAIAAVDDDDAAAPLVAELKSLAARKNAVECERDALRARLADRAADTAKFTSLSAWCSRVNANLDTLSYAEKRTALEALGVKVQIYRQGTADNEGNPYPRWALTLAPVSTGEPFVYPPTGSDFSAGNQKRGSR